MSLVTYGDLKTYVQNRLDLRDEDFITADELLEYTEEALRFCEAEVHKLNIEDMYFEAEGFLALVSGQQDYSLPSNIYANKIIRIVDNAENRMCEIPRLNHSKRFEDAANTDKYSGTTSYRYRLINNNPNVGTKLRFHPIPNESSTTVAFTADTTNGSTSLLNASTVVGLGVGQFVTGTGIRSGTRIQSISGTTVVLNQSASATGTTVALTAVEDRVRVHYIRRVEIPTVTTDYIDFPEFWNFIAQHVVVACLKKELGNPRLTVELEYLKELQAQMHSTLSEMTPDQDDLIESDVSHYVESYDGGF